MLEGDIALIGIASSDTKMVLVGRAVWIQIAGGNLTKLGFFSFALMIYDCPAGKLGQSREADTRQRVRQGRVPAYLFFCGEFLSSDCGRRNTQVRVSELISAHLLASAPPQESTGPFTSK